MREYDTPVVIIIKVVPAAPRLTRARMKLIISACTALVVQAPGRWYMEQAQSKWAAGMLNTTTWGEKAALLQRVARTIVSVDASTAYFKRFFQPRSVVGSLLPLGLCKSSHILASAVTV